MASSLFSEVKKLARAEGLAEGRVVAARSLCVDFVRQYRPGILSLVSPVIEAVGDAREPGPRAAALEARQGGVSPVVRRRRPGRPARPRSPA